MAEIYDWNRNNLVFPSFRTPPQEDYEDEGAFLHLVEVSDSSQDDSLRTKIGDAIGDAALSESAKKVIIGVAASGLAAATIAQFIEHC